jgi:ABC-type dipeptide/oligopeptide/nickel transport system permease component
MILRTLQVAVLSFLLFVIAAVTFEKYSEFKEHNFSYAIKVFLQVFFYGIPLFILGFSVLLVVNWILISLLRNKSRHSKNKTYFGLATLLAILPILAFILFDYSQRGRYFAPENTFIAIFLKYSISFIWVAIALLLNRKIVWKNFPNS